MTQNLLVHIHPSWPGFVHDTRNISTHLRHHGHWKDSHSRSQTPHCQNCLFHINEITKTKRSKTLQLSFWKTLKLVNQKSCSSFLFCFTGKVVVFAGICPTGDIKTAPLTVGLKKFFFCYKLYWWSTLFHVYFCRALRLQIFLIKDNGSDFPKIFLIKIDFFHK